MFALKVFNEDIILDPEFSFKANFKPFPFCSQRKCSMRLQRTEQLPFDKSYACKPVIFLFLTERIALEMRSVNGMSHELPPNFAPIIFFRSHNSSKLHW